MCIIYNTKRDPVYGEGELVYVGSDRVYDEAVRMAGESDGVYKVCDNVYGESVRTCGETDPTARVTDKTKKTGDGSNFEQVIPPVFAFQ